MVSTSKLRISGVSDMNVYFISGLGADERIFKNLVLPEGYETHHIAWEKVGREESIQDYARRLARNIDSGKPFILAGLSFGGIIAREICRFLPPAKLILFSTIAVRGEMPALYRIAGKYGLYKFFPTYSSALRLPFLYWFFGPLNEDGKRLLHDYITNKDAVFMKWAIKQLTLWKNDTAFERCIHIQGSLDRAFPINLCRPDYIIEKAGHLCVFTHATEVNEILRKELTCV